MPRGVATSKILSANKATCSKGRESAVEAKISLTLVGNFSKNNCRKMLFSSVLEGLRFDNGSDYDG